MNLGRAFHPTMLAERGFDRRLSLPAPTPGGGWVVSFQDHPDVYLLDRQLDEILTLNLGAQSQNACSTAVAMSPDGQAFAVSARSELRIVSRTGVVLHRIAHRAWPEFTGSGCFFDPNGRLWYVRPGDRLGIDDQVVVLDPEAGRAVAATTIPNGVGHFALYPCPDGGTLIDVACGQDGSFLSRAWLNGSDLMVEEYPYCDRTFVGGFAPDGREFATGAHEGDSVKVHSYPGGGVVATLDSEAVFAADTLVGESADEVGYQAIFVGPDHILADTRYGRLLLIGRQAMRLMGTVWPPGSTLRGYDSFGREADDPRRIIGYEGGITSFHPAGEGRVLIVCEERVIRLLDMTPVLSVSD